MRTAATHGRVVPVAPALEGEALREGVVDRGVVAGDDRVRRVDGESVVAEPVGWRHAGGVARRSGPAHATAQPAGDRLSAEEAGQQGEAPAGPLGTVAEEAVVRRGGAALDDLVAPGPRPATSCWRFAATRSTSQWPGPSGRATSASSAAGATASDSARRTSSVTW